MIYRIPCTKDTFISNVSASGNCGQNPILKVAKRTDIDGNTYIYRSLLYFDTSSIKALQDSGSIPWDTSSMEFRLKMFDCYFSGSYPTSFDIVIHPVASYSWDEGSGIEFDLSQSGTVNWNQAQSNQNWDSAGGDYDISYSASQHFDTGSEDLNVDITEIFTKYMDGTLPNYGLILKLSSSQEISGSGADNYDHKLFFGRSTITNYEPYVELKWDDTIKDDGSTIVSFNPKYSSYGNYFYLYNSVNGVLEDFPNVSTGSNTDLIYTLYNDSGSVIKSITASWKERGIWEAGPITGSNTGVEDVYYTGSWVSSGGGFQIDEYYLVTLHEFDRTELDVNEYIVSLRNLKQEYQYGEHYRIDIFCRYAYPAYSFASGNEDLTSVPLRRLYYEIRDAETNETIIGYHPVYTRCSWDSGGNYFRLWTENLKRGKLYRIYLINYENRDTSWYSNYNWTFKVI